jgi:glycosyltransferase involved in cell wall biosynthesis
VHMPSFGPGYPSAASTAFRFVERKLAERTDVLVYVGGDVRTLYEEAGVFPRSRSMVVESPIDVERFLAVREVRPKVRAGIREELGLDPQLPVALMVGALEARKRHDLAVTRLAPLLSTNRLQLLIVGRGDCEKGIRHKAEALGVSRNVRFVGFRADVERSFAAASVLVHTSITEGVPQVVIQALAAGVSVVATSAPGTREVVSPAVIVLPSDATGLSERVAAVLAAQPVLAPVGVIERWMPESVEERLADLQQHILATVARRNGAPELSTSVTCR